MIGDFFTKPVGGAKFWRFHDIIMNISHDAYGPFDVDKLMAIYNENMTKRFDMVLEGTTADRYEMNEHSISKEQRLAESSSQQCVEGQSKQSSMMWVSARNAHKRSRYNKTIKGDHTWQGVYVQVATLASE